MNIFALVLSSMTKPKNVKNDIALFLNMYNIKNTSREIYIIEHLLPPFPLALHSLVFCGSLAV